uniref:Uncharacterized protein n=2 Tax=Oryza sativa subsp. japonica TaxID=39947 RepID=Q53Q90_ORYSJ|nr:hypothetical protein LOC_Os11g17550 [Oryza sativa Japonica Group]ABA92620.1 hypothetical protein LOC_Os11g17550 [Oryza sativa Japonica Group]
MSLNSKGKIYHSSDQVHEESSILKGLYDAQGFIVRSIMNANDDQKLQLETEASHANLGCLEVVIVFLHLHELEELPLDPCQKLKAT